GQLCNATTTPSTVATGAASPLNAGVISVAGGTFHSVALTAAGTVSTCGRNNFGQLGNGTTTNSSTPVAVTLPVGAVATAVASDDTVLAWGLNNFGQLGTGDTTNRPVPAPALGGITVAAIACGGIHSLAIKRSDGTGLAWGRNNDGQLGAGTTAAFLTTATPL